MNKFIKYNTRSIWTIAYSNLPPQKVPLLRSMHSPPKNLLQLAVLDWSGTLVDPSVFAPAVAFVSVFKKHGVEISIDEAREPMGKHKKVHIAEICKNPMVKEKWKLVHGHYPNDVNIDNMFEDFTPEQLNVLSKYGVPIPLTFETVKHMKSHYDLKIGCSTGFTRIMVNKIMDLNPELYSLMDITVAADEVKHARPYPYMVWSNMQQLELKDPRYVVKVDDTQDGIKEAVNARCWGVGVAKHSNYVGILPNELDELEKNNISEYQRIINNSRMKLWNAGAHYVIDTLDQIPLVLDNINKRLENQEYP